MQEIKEVDFSHVYDKKPQTSGGEVISEEQSPITENKIIIMKIYKSKYFKIGIIVTMVIGTIFVLVMNNPRFNSPTQAPGTLNPNAGLPPNIPPLPTPEQ